MKSLSRLLIAALAAQLLPLTCYAGDFAKDVKRRGGEFTLPEGYVEVPVQKNRDMSYEFAIRHPTQKFEVRYAVRPISQESVKEYREWAAKKDKGGKFLTDPNVRFRGLFQAILSNITQRTGAATKTQPFPEKAVKEEFAADSGAVAVSNMKSQFGSGYKQCLMVGIHKNDVGDIFIFYLYDNPDDAMPLEKEIFHALKFRSGATEQSSD